MNEDKPSKYLSAVVPCLYQLGGWGNAANMRIQASTDVPSGKTTITFAFHDVNVTIALTHEQVNKYANWFAWADRCHKERREILR